VKIIDEIRRQRAILGAAQVDRLILSHFAFEQLLAEKDEFGLHQFNTQTIPPTVYGMSISVADDPGPDVAVLAGAQTL
jgi:hypothetical protein